MFLGSSTRPISPAQHHIDSARWALDLVEQLIDVQVPVASVRQIHEQFNGRSIRGLLYTPFTASTEQELVPVLVFLHGGGMVIGSAAASDRLCRFALNNDGSWLSACECGAGMSCSQQAIVCCVLCVFLSWELETGGWRT